MMPAPQNKVQSQQTYADLWATDPTLAYFIEIELAPSTNIEGYKPGCILAQYTFGQYKGLCVNYDPNGKDGQNQALIILTDQYLTPEMQKFGTLGQALVQTVLGGATFHKRQIYFNAQNGQDDITQAIAQIGGKVAFDKVSLYAIGK